MGGREGGSWGGGERAWLALANTTRLHRRRLHPGLRGPADRHGQLVALHAHRLLVLHGQPGRLPDRLPDGQRHQVPTRFPSVSLPFFFFPLRGKFSACSEECVADGLRWLPMARLAEVMENG